MFKGYVVAVSLHIIKIAWSLPSFYSFAVTWLFMTNMVKLLFCKL